MADQPSVDQGNRIEASKLFEAARDHAAQGNFDEAKKLYERSLRLCEDAVVRNAYLEFLATVGPM
ncbi:MAG: tetratricopeptide repeat protein [Gammaproteobacteria bacterium]